MVVKLLEIEVLILEMKVLHLVKQVNILKEKIWI